MKRAIIAVVASMFVFASAYAADAVPTAPQMLVKMSAEDCKKAMSDCKEDQTCKDNLVRVNGCQADKDKE